VLRYSRKQKDAKLIDLIAESVAVTTVSPSSLVEAVASPVVSTSGVGGSLLSSVQSVGVKLLGFEPSMVVFDGYDPVGSDGVVVLASPSLPPEAMSVFVAPPMLDSVGVANTVKVDVWNSLPAKRFLQWGSLGSSPAVQVISHPLPEVSSGVGSGLSSSFDVGGFDSSLKLDISHVGGPLLLLPRPILLSSTVTGCSPQFLSGMSRRDKRSYFVSEMGESSQGG
jgi:hypothetical protein